MLFFLSLEKSAQFEAPAGNQTHLLAWPPAGSFLSFRLAEGDVIRTLRNSFFQWDSEASFVWTARPTVPQWGDTGWPRHSVVGRLPPLSMISENIPIGHAAQGPPVWHPVTGMCLFHFHKFTQTNIITNTFFSSLDPHPCLLGTCWLHCLNVGTLGVRVCGATPLSFLPRGPLLVALEALPPLQSASAVVKTFFEKM